MKGVREWKTTVQFDFKSRDDLTCGFTRFAVHSQTSEISAGAFNVVEQPPYP